MAHDNCDSCDQDYDFEKGRDTLVMYMLTPEANHVEAHCPHCEAETRIYLTPDGLMQVLELHLSLRLGKEAPEEILESAQELWGEDGMWLFRRRNDDEYDLGSDEANKHWSNVFRREGQDSLPEPPRDWLIQLHDMMRHFNRHDCPGGECTHES